MADGPDIRKGLPSVTTKCDVASAHVSAEEMDANRVQPGH